MRTLSTRVGLVVLVAILWSLFVCLCVSGNNTLQLETLLGVVLCGFVPGWCLLLGFRLQFPPWILLALSVAGSILALMLVVLTGNTVLPWVGVAAPLDAPVVLVEITALLAASLVCAWFQINDWQLSISTWVRTVYPRGRDVWLSLLPLLFVVQAVYGAFVLNNGGSEYLTLALLGEILIYFSVLVRMAPSVEDNTIATGMSLVGAALLLMTSMRGWHITGHDIQREFAVFQLTKTNGVWSMAAYRDAYNACLSITLLPTVFANVLRLPDVYIFKLLFQLFFALVPGVVYLTNRFWLRREYAILATIYFVGFPTFFLDMPFLVRQEIAFLFFSLMLYVLFEPTLGLRARRLLFILCGVGVILSHYSTTYTTLFVLLLATLTYPLLVRALTSTWMPNRIRAAPVVAALLRETALRGRQLTFGMVACLIALSLVWTSSVTHTGGSVTRVVLETLGAVRDGFTENSRSVDVVNLFTFSKASQQQELDAYIKDTVVPTRNSAVPSTYVATSTYAAYTYTALPDEKRPDTALSVSIKQAVGIDAGTTSALLGQLVAKLMELLAPLGLLCVLWRRESVRRINLEYLLLVIFSFVFIAMNIILPVLSTEYGILRALLQSLFIIGPLIVIATVLLGDALATISTTHSWRSSTIPLIIALLFFAYSTGFVSQLFGDNAPLLHLNNSGRYYDSYLVQGAGIAAERWLLAQNRGASTIAVDHNFAQQFALTDVSFADGIFPGLVRRDAFVFVTQPTYTDGRASLLYNGDQVVYSYPTQFLDATKDRIYDNGFAHIYR